MSNKTNTNEASKLLWISQLHHVGGLKDECISGLDLEAVEIGELAHLRLIGWDNFNIISSSLRELWK